MKKITFIGELFAFFFSMALAAALLASYSVARILLAAMASAGVPSS